MIKIRHLFGCFVLSITALIITKAQTEEIKPLLPEQTIQRELAGGQTHKYKIEAKANEFLQIKVEQKGIDVVVRLFDKDGKQLAEMDSPNGDRGPEILMYITAEAGVYRVEVGSSEANTKKGDYTIFLETPRAATEKDRKALQAKIVFGEAQAFFSQRTVKSFQEAREKFLTARGLYQESGEKSAEAQSLVFAGRISDVLGEKDAALRYYEAALPLFQEPDKFLKATTLNNIGKSHIDLKNEQKALNYLEQALPLFRDLKHKNGEAYTLQNLGLAYSGLRKNREALQFYEQALPLFRAVGDKGGEAVTFVNKGKVFFDLGDNQKALDFYHRALPLFCAIQDKDGMATVLNNIAVIYKNSGELQRAKDLFDLALPLSRAVGNRFLEATALNHIGFIYIDLKEEEEALKNLTEALQIFRLIANKEGEAHTLINIGKVYDNSNKPTEAREKYEQALLIFREIDHKNGMAITFNNIGIIYFYQNNPQKALENYSKALSLFRETGDTGSEAATMGNIGIAYVYLMDIRRSLEHFYSSLQLSRAANRREQEAMVLNYLMRVWDARGDRKTAIFYGKQSVNKYQELRQNIKGFDREFQKSFLIKVQEPYHKLIELLIIEERFPEAERVVRMLKEEEYFEFVSRDGSVISSLDERINLTPGEKQAAERYEKLAFEIEQIGKEYENLEKRKALESDEQAKITSERQTELNKKLETALLKLRTFLVKFGETFAQKETNPQKVEQSSQAIIKEWNDPHTAVIVTIFGEDNLSVIVTTSESQRGYVINISENELKKLVGDFRSALVSRGNVKPAAQKLYNVLVKPLEKDLEKIKARTMVWSLDKFLRYVPVAALWDKDKGYVAENYASVGLALASRENLAFRPENKNSWQALGVGVSEKSGDLPALSYVPEELQAIVRETSAENKKQEFGIIEGRRLLNREFTYDSFVKNLGKYRFTHAASHFSFIPGTKAEGLNSFLLLGNGEKLTLAQVQNSEKIFNGIELLTLSACDTAYGGKTADGREIEGFGVLAQRKGARAIMATLWRVNDESTRYFMVDFYDFYKKSEMTKAEALRQAQLAMIKGGEFAHPYFWSPFILIGNWR
ncbi:MAG TPA: tetratricopeptide repeat protein [Pyrinomonadaceae bacterium]|nr:tetratricopeptide repeat protein [Pyrinomonadaceae bacterium]